MDDGQFILSWTRSFGKTGTGHLYFYKADNKYGCFDVYGTAIDERTVWFELYTPSFADENSEIPGFKKINDVTEIENGQEYLIVAVHNEAYDLLYPSAGTNAKDHVAKVLENEKIPCINITNSN